MTTIIQKCITCRDKVNTEVDYECDVCGIFEHLQCLALNNNKHNWSEMEANAIEKDLCGKCAKNKKKPA